MISMQKHNTFGIIQNINIIEIIYKPLSELFELPQN